MEGASLPSSSEQSYGPGSEETLIPFAASAPGARVVLVIHGGNWTAGNQFLSLGENPPVRPQCEKLQKEGFCVFTMNYPLAKTLVASYGGPKQIEAVKRAVDWITLHAAEYNGNAASLVFLGGSCGAHLAHFGAQYVNKIAGTRKVLAVVGLSGPMDLVEIVKHKELGADVFAFTGFHNAEVETPGSTGQKTAEEYSPIHNIDKATSPKFQLWGGVGADIVGYYQQEEFNTALLAAGCTVDLKGARSGHSFAYWTQEQENGRTVAEMAIEYLKTIT